MGEIADMILNGTLCEGCGDVFDDVVGGAEAPGRPRRCPTCSPISLQRALKTSISPRAVKAERHNREHHEAARSRKPFQCSKCHRLFETEQGRSQHIRDVHNRPDATTSLLTVLEQTVAALRSGAGPEERMNAIRDGNAAIALAKGITS